VVRLCESGPDQDVSFVLASDIYHLTASPELGLCFEKSNHKGNKMNWDAIGAVAELIGSAAVIITLLYLAIQTHSNGKVLRASAAWDSQMSFVAINEKLADGGVISEIMFRTLSDPDSLTPYEKYLLHRYLRGVFQRLQAQFALYTNGILDAEIWHLRREYIMALIDKNQLVKESWELDKQNRMLTKAFIEAMDKAPHSDIAGFMGINPPIGERP
jgi:hypothetical protein